MCLCVVAPMSSEHVRTSHKQLNKLKEYSACQLHLFAQGCRNAIHIKTCTLRLSYYTCLWRFFYDALVTKKFSRIIYSFECISYSFVVSSLTELNYTMTFTCSKCRWRYAIKARSWLQQIASLSLYSWSSKEILRVNRKRHKRKKFLRKNDLITKTVVLNLFNTFMLI